MVLCEKKVDRTLFTKTPKLDIFIVQVYIVDIIFGAAKDLMCQDFSKLMQGEYGMSMIRHLAFLLRLQIKQSKAGIAICQAKYIKELLRKYQNE